MPEETSEKLPYGLTQPAYDQIEERVKLFSSQVQGISFAFLNPTEIFQIYTQIALSVMLLNTPGQSLPIGFTIPIGGKSYRFQGTVAEETNSASPENDG